jgi:hypothetical protein
MKATEKMALPKKKKSLSLWRNYSVKQLKHTDLRFLRISVFE